MIVQGKSPRPMFAIASIAAARCLARGLRADLRRPMGAFRADRAGNVTLVFGIAVVPLAGAVAAARDAIT